MAGATEDCTQIARTAKQNKSKTAPDQAVHACAPGRIRTCDTGFRRACKPS